LFGLKVWAMSALGLRENSTEHNLLNYQVGPQSGSNAGSGGLSEAHKEPDNTFSMPDPTNSLRVRSTFSMPDDGIRTSSPPAHSVCPTQTFTSSPPAHSVCPATRFVHQVLIRHRHPVVEHVYVYVHMRDYRCLFIRPVTCIWSGILFISISHASSPRAMLSPLSTIPRCSTSRDTRATRQQSRLVVNQTREYLICYFEANSLFQILLRKLFSQFLNRS
jgi:hypothetical protein